MGSTLSLRMRVRSYHSHPVAWQRSANKDASLFRTSDILKISYIKIKINKRIDPASSIQEQKSSFLSENVQKLSKNHSTVQKAVQVEKHLHTAYDVEESARINLEHSKNTIK